MSDDCKQDEAALPPVAGSGLGMVDYRNIRKNPPPVYINDCKGCGKWFFAISKHYPSCRLCGGDPQYVYANAPGATQIEALRNGQNDQTEGPAA